MIECVQTVVFFSGAGTEVHRADHCQVQVGCPQLPQQELSPTLCHGTWGQMARQQGSIVLTFPHYVFKTLQVSGAKGTLSALRSPPACEPRGRGKDFKLMVREAPSSDIRDPGNEEKLVCNRSCFILVSTLASLFPLYIF